MDIFSIINQVKKENPNAKDEDIMKVIQMILTGGQIPKVEEISEDEKKEVLNLDTSIDGLVKYIKEKASNIIVLAGAGISVNAGIPDFRTPGTGLYDNLQKYDLERPEDIFSIDFFKKNPIPFYTLSKEMLPEDKQFKPTLAHKFIKLLSDKKKLLRCYTQNIDGLEYQAGTPEEFLIECHGHFRICHCIKCHKEFETKKFKELMYKDKFPIKCESCEGLVKPDIVFFGESLPKKFHTGVRKDFPKCDLLIVMGSSLMVSPVCNLVDEIGPKVPRVLMNMEKVGPFQYINDEDNYRDVLLLGDCDKSVTELCKKLNWEL